MKYGYTFLILSIALIVKAQSPPTALFSVSDTVICEGDCIDFTDLSTDNATSWQWIFEGANTGVALIQNPSGICYSTAGTYSVTLTARNLTGTDTLRKTGYIVVNPKPQPLLSINGFVISVLESYSSYQWYAEGVGGNPDVLLENENDSTYCIRHSGTYYVIVTNSFGCSTTSILIEKHYMLRQESSPCTTAINETEINPVSIQPNPSSGMLFVSNTSPTNYVVSLTDMYGRVVFEKGFFGTQKQEINIAFLAKGVYFASVIMSESRVMQKIMVE